MRQVKSRNTSAEKALLAAIKAEGLKGWRRHYTRAFGVPDIAFPRQKVAIFIDGCFWHGCRKCYRQPKSNVGYWVQKVARNKERAREVNLNLKRRGWRTLRIWEHDAKKLQSGLVKKITKTIENSAK